MYPLEEVEATMARSRYRVSLYHPLRSVYVRDSHEQEPLMALADVERFWAKDNPSLDGAGIMRVDIRRVHEDDEIEGVVT